VHPIAALPEETLAAGGRVAILNKGPTPYDLLAAVKLEDNAADVLGAVAKELA
jgi:NAD-dependent deacetylase